MTDAMSTGPVVVASGMPFEVWIADGGQTYEWRSRNGSLSVGRSIDHGTCWARVDGKLIGKSFGSAKQAMDAAVAAQRSALGRIFERVG